MRRLPSTRSLAAGVLRLMRGPRREVGAKMCHASRHRKRSAFPEIFHLRQIPAPPGSTATSKAGDEKMATSNSPMHGMPIGVR